MSKILFSLKKAEQYRAINELIEESQSDGQYHFLLILSSVIIGAGVLLANSAILVGGMLVTPILTPILLIALAIISGETRLLIRTSFLVLKSLGVILLVSFIMGLIFSIPSESEFFDSTIFNNTLNAAVLYGLVAFASGIAATFAWIRKEVTSILPGISIAVSLVPPVSLVAVWLADGDFDRARHFFFVLVLNIIGVILGAIIVFSMLRFYRVEKHIEDKVEKVLQEEEELEEESKIEQPSTLKPPVKKTRTRKKKQSGNGLIWLIVVVSILLIWVGATTLGSPKVPGAKVEEKVVEVDSGEEVSTPSLNSYVNNNFNFSLDLPVGWEAKELDIEDVPVIHFTKTLDDVSGIGLYDNVSRVSVYPEGIPDRVVVFGGFERESVISSPFGANVTSNIDDNDQWFVEWIEPQEPPESWSAKGFILLNAEIKDQELECRRDGEVISLDDCDTLGDDVLMPIGEISQGDIDDLEYILNSFTFVK